MIRADPRHLCEAREWAEQAAWAAGLDDGDCYQVKLAMSEAVANAIQHGSRGPMDTVEMSIFEEGGALVFEVRDSGSYVPRDRHPDEDGGRGLELLSLMMDEAEIASVEGGTLMRFAKRLP